jgi:hypothetical protein
MLHVFVYSSLSHKIRVDVVCFGLESTYESVFMSCVDGNVCETR